MVVELYPHNRTAYEAVISMLHETGKACVIHPTGTGKSFIAFRYAADHPEEHILWLAPSEYIYRTQLENWHHAGGEVLPNITFCTYVRLMQMAPVELKSLRPNTVILDEFHRTGAEQWGLGVQRLLDTFPNAQLIGLSATNIRYLDNQRDMAAELFDGHIASEMSLGEAIVRGILPAPKYVLSIFKYRDDLAKYELRAKKAKSKATRDAAEEIIEKLRRALDNATGMDVLFDKHMSDRTGKYLVFCANAEHMRDMMSHVSEWFWRVDPHPRVYSAYSDDPGTSKAFADFKADNSDHLKLLFCIDMLNEGIHVPDVSGVILLRPTVSPIIYKQQIGRALSSSHRSIKIDSKPNEVGLDRKRRNSEVNELSCRHREANDTEFVPTIFDVVLNIENLYSISSIQEEMEVAMTYYRDLGEGDSITDSFEIIDEVHDCLELFDRLNDTLTASWDLMYEIAKHYYVENGDLLVPKRYTTAKGYSLGFWIETQRRVRKGSVNGILTPMQISLLDNIGMRWESMADLNWSRFYAAAQQYYAEHGDLRVNSRYVTPDGLNLGVWIANLRSYRKSGIKTGYLTPARIEDMDRLGMSWDVYDTLFETGFSAAMSYRLEHGDLNVPRDYVMSDGFRLGPWLSRLNRVRAGQVTTGRGITEEQIARLDAIGMVWGNRLETAWERGYAYAKDYFLEHHDLSVPPSYKTIDGFKLGDWVCNQRERYRRDTLPENRRRRLDEIGMVWVLPDLWDSRYEVARQYYEEHGDLCMPDTYLVDGFWISRWLDEQRKIHNGERKGKELRQDQIDRLDAIGMVWMNKLDAAWERRFQAVSEWYWEHGDLRIPDSIEIRGMRNLGNWVLKQRLEKRKGTLRKDREERLDKLCPDWWK